MRIKKIDHDTKGITLTFRGWEVQMLEAAMRGGHAADYIMVSKSEVDINNLVQIFKRHMPLKDHAFVDITFGSHWVEYTEQNSFELQSVSGMASTVYNCGAKLGDPGSVEHELKPDKLYEELVNNLSNICLLLWTFKFWDIEAKIAEKKARGAS